MTPISGRALNRATLARQLLLRRRPLPALEAVEHLVGMQAQAPLAPYVGLWSRLDGFQPDELASAITERRAVRAGLMRSTIHLVTVRDALGLLTLMRPALDRAWRGSQFSRHVDGIDLPELLAAGRALLAERPRTRAELRVLLAERWPDHDGDSLAYTVTYLTPCVQVPPRGLWGASGPPAWAPVDSWLGRPPDPAPTPDSTVLRYLAAFGPATVRDAQVWSGLTRLREVFDRLRPRLLTFRDGDVRELFDLPDAPRPDEGTPAPPRFLPEYDNVLLSHADRGRVIPDGRPVPLPAGNGASTGTVLIDGMFRATWRLDPAGLAVDAFTRLSPAEREAVTQEGGRLLAFVRPAAGGEDVRIVPC